MFTCILCQFPAELDDAMVPTGGHCICLRCWTKELGSSLRMPKSLRRELEAATA